MQNSATARRKQLLTQAYNQQLGVVSDQSVKEVRYNILKKEVDANRDIYQSMLQRVKEASIVAALRSSDVRVVSPGTAANLALPAEFAAEPVLGTALGPYLRDLLHPAARAQRCQPAVAGAERQAPQRA